MDDDSFSALCRVQSSSYTGPLADPITGPIWRPFQDAELRPTPSIAVFCPWLETASEGYQGTTNLPLWHEDNPFATTMPSPPTGPPALQSLPRNVRELIYKYALTYSHPLQLRKRTYHRFWRIGYKVSRALRISWNFTPPLLRTCLQIEVEATKIFFAENTFRIDVPDGDLHDLFEWLRDTPPEYVRLVQQLMIQIEPTCVAQLIELAERANDEKGLWNQAVEFADAVSKAGIDTDNIRCHIGKFEDQQSVSPERAMIVADRWLQRLATALDEIKRLEGEEGEGGQTRLTEHGEAQQSEGYAQMLDSMRSLGFRRVEE